MATVQFYMNYNIFFQDDAEYAFAVSVAGGNFLKLAPRDAATLFGISFPYPSGDLGSILKGILFYFPYTPGTEFKFPNPSGIFVDDAILTKTVPGQAGNPPSIWPPGPDGLFTWSGNIIKSGGGAQAGEPAPVAIPQRRWIGGRELGQNFEGGTSASVQNQSRDYSRTIDGGGFGIRGNINTGVWNRTIIEFRPALTPRTSWERFYVRFRRLPSSVNTGFWRCHGSPSNAAGVGLKFMTVGTVRAFDINATSTESDKGIVHTPVLNKWYRYDVLLKYGSGALPGIIVIYINGVNTFTFSDSAFGGISGNTHHTNTDLGLWTATDAEAEIDLDDWICADLPANCNPDTLVFIDINFSIDWLIGSHIRKHFSDSASQINWNPAGAAEGVENQDISPQTRLGTSELTSTISDATLEGLTDALLQTVTDVYAIVIGAASAVIALFSKNSGGTDGQLGYRKAGAAAVLATINQLTTEADQKIMYLPTGMITPDEITPWSTVHTKSADVNTDTSYMMLSAVEYIGIWGEEDDTQFQFPISRLTFLHNSRYGNTPYGYFGSQPDAPVFAVGGTYVGNGTYQEIILPSACHFLWVRPITGGIGGVKFFGASIGPHFGAKDRVVPNIRMWYDFTTQQFKFSVTGAATSEVNISGTTYQYIAFCDPGMRFSICGAFGHGNSSSVPKSNPLINTGFIPDAMFAQRDLISSISSVEGLFYRGPGHTANNISSLTGTLLANGANLAAGIINSFQELHSSGLTNYMVFRMADSGATGCAGTMIQVLSYVGDGVNPRNITLTPISGRFPLFVMVTPASATAASFMRDPSHTGSDSSNVDTLANSTTAITGVGVDQITVNSSLNVNGTTYTVFVICGDTAGMNNGSFFPTYCDNGGPWVPPNPPQGDINIVGNGGLVLNGTTPLTLLKDVSGIYTLVPGKLNDTLYDRQTGQTSVDRPVKPKWKTGYVGG